MRAIANNESYSTISLTVGNTPTPVLFWSKCRTVLRESLKLNLVDRLCCTAAIFLARISTSITNCCCCPARPNQQRITWPVLSVALNTLT